MKKSDGDKVLKIGKENSTFQHLETLRRNRQKRHRSGEFVVEGVRSINNAISADWEIRGVIYAKTGRLSAWAEDVLVTCDSAIRYELSVGLMSKISDKEKASEVMLLVGMPEDDLSRIEIKENLLVVVLDRPSSPGNLGSIIRSADALGADGVIITGHSVDVYSQETISATTGSLFSVPIVRLRAGTEFTRWCADVRSRLDNLQLVGTDEKATEPINSIDFNKPTVLIMGNETHGISACYAEMSDLLAFIPMVGSASSLNVACSASIALYEAQRQRGV